MNGLSGSRHASATHTEADAMSPPSPKTISRMEADIMRIFLSLPRAWVILVLVIRSVGSSVTGNPNDAASAAACSKARIAHLRSGGGWWVPVLSFGLVDACPQRAHNRPESLLCR